MENDWVINVKDLNFKHKGFELQDITFNVKSGARFAIVGQNGSGKTTLFRTLVNLNKKNSGSINVLGQELNRKTEWDIRSIIGYLFQNPEDQIFSPTVREEISFGPRNLGFSEEEIEETVEHSLNHVEMKEYADHSPNHLSWGQKKRVALAAILAMKPKILLLDEPFANLDNNSVLNLFKILEELREKEHVHVHVHEHVHSHGESHTHDKPHAHEHEHSHQHPMTILFTTHNYFIIENWADYMLVLDQGKIIFQGKPKEGLALENVRKALGDLRELEKIINAKKE